MGLSIKTNRLNNRLNQIAEDLKQSYKCKVFFDHPNQTMPKRPFIVLKVISATIDGVLGQYEYSYFTNKSIGDKFISHDINGKKIYEQHFYVE